MPAKWKIVEKRNYSIPLPFVYTYKTFVKIFNLPFYIYLGSYHYLPEALDAIGKERNEVELIEAS